jgi:hypothetical protein
MHKHSNSTHLSIKSRVHPERPIFVWLIKKSSAFRRIQMPIASYIAANGFSLSWAKLIKFLPHTLFSQHFNYVDWLLKVGQVEKGVAAVVKQRWGKHVSAATNQHATEEMLEAVLSVGWIAPGPRKHSYSWFLVPRNLCPCLLSHDSAVLCGPPEAI